MISFGTPNQQIHLVKTDFATISRLLSDMPTSSTYYENASMKLKSQNISLVVELSTLLNKLCYALVHARPPAFLGQVESGIDNLKSTKKK